VSVPTPARRGLALTLALALPSLALAAAPARGASPRAAPPGGESGLAGDLPPAAAALASRLAHDLALLDRPHERPIHRGTASPGSLGDALAAHLPAFEAEAKRGRDQPDRSAPWAELASGRRLARELTAEERAVLLRLEPHLDAILAGTRAARADLAACDDPFRPAPGTLWGSVGLAATLAGARARLALERGDPASALHDCLDGLALLRDAAVAGGLAGHLTAASALPALSPACQSSLDAASPEGKREAFGALGAIRAALPPLAEVFRVEGLQLELTVYGKLAGARVREHAGPRARAWIDEGDAAPTSAEDRRSRAAQWRLARSGWDQLIRAGGLDPAERPAAIRSALRLFEASRSGLPWAGPGFETYAVSIETAARRLDALTLAAAAHVYRLERGAWPMDARVLATWLPAGSAGRAAAQSARLTGDAGWHAVTLVVLPGPGAAPDAEPVLAVATAR